VRLGEHLRALWISVCNEHLDINQLFDSSRTTLYLTPVRLGSLCCWDRTR
jgi:hypothetical protein